MADYLREWWEFATVGRGMGKDIYGVPFDIEIKARASLDIKGTLRQIEARTVKSGDLGFACFRLNGQGEDAREYAALIRLEDLVKLLLKAGYGDYQDSVDNLEPERCKQCGSWKFTNCPCKTCALCKEK